MAIAQKEKLRCHVITARAQRQGLLCSARTSNDNRISALSMTHLHGQRLAVHADVGDILGLLGACAHGIAAANL